MSVDMKKLEEELRPNSVTAVSKLKSIAPSYDAISGSGPVTKPSISELQNTRQETFTLTDEWHCEEWDKVIAFAVLKMTYSQYMEFMDGVNASFKEADDPGLNAEQVSHRAVQAWSRKRLSK